MSRLLWPKKTISFYNPKAESVSLVIDSLDICWSMKPNDRGYWSIKPSLPFKDFKNLSYHFRVEENGKIRKITDPTARRLGMFNKNCESYFADLNYQFRNRYFYTTPFHKIVIYETHLPALTRHASAKLPVPRYKGTYLGASSEFILEYLQNLSVAVEFLPLHYNDEELGKDWGYYSKNYHSMRVDFAVNKDNVNNEVMQLVDSLHGKKIPVILDVVFNHGAELWVKAWGEEIVYRQLDNGDYCNGSGCGETINTEHSHIRQTIIDSLLYLVNQYRFDGFRFDLGALHDIETMLEIDKKLPNRIYLISEPWALSGSKWGKGEMSSVFAKTRWAIWNDDFRESGKTFIKGKGDHHNRDLLMRGIVGSHVDDGGWALRPQQCINYISCHDGKTLNDLVKGDKQRVFLAIFLVLTSQGIPMLGEGSEMLYSKQGHDNSYDCPDLNQLNWDDAQKHSDLVKAVARLIVLRKQFSHFRYRGHLKVNDKKKSDWNIDWIYPTGFPHNDNVNAIGYLLRRPSGLINWNRDQHTLLILMNGSHSGVNFQLPKGKWKVLVDGFHIKTDINGISITPPAKNHYHLHPGTCAMLTPN